MPLFKAPRHSLSISIVEVDSMHQKAKPGLDRVILEMEARFGKVEPKAIGDDPRNDITLLEYRKILRDVRVAADHARAAVNYARSAVGDLNSLADRVADLARWREQELGIPQDAETFDDHNDPDWEGA